MNDLALSGVRVLELSTSYSGPTATMYLGDLGADVIKLERSPAGDDSRGWGPPFIDDSSAWFYSVNRNKRSISIDLRVPRGLEVLERLLGTTDVLVENFLPSKLDTLGLEPESVCKRHPRLIYCAISGFGLTGPDAHLPGYDLIAQARSGLMSVTGELGGIPQRVSTALSDIVTGVVAALAIVAALHRRQRSGSGELIDVSLLDTDLALMAPRIASYLAGEPEPRPSGGTDSVLAVYQAFETQDRPIVVAIGNEVIWRRFCEALELPELGHDPSLADNAQRRLARSSILPKISERLRCRPAIEWLEIFAQAAVPASAIQSLSEVVADPQVQFRDGIRALQTQDGKLAQVVSAPWRLGFQSGPTASQPMIGSIGSATASVLRELGFSIEDIASLRECGAIAGPDPVTP